MSSRPVLSVTLSVLASLAFAAGCGASADSTNGQSVDGAAPSSATKCCPPDGQISGSMYLGGKADEGGTCHKTYDFWCSQNWRLEKDESGCETWRYDVRSPGVGENGQCQPQPPQPGG